jgi:hypothetical protein
MDATRSAAGSLPPRDTVRVALFSTVHDIAAAEPLLSTSMYDFELLDSEKQGCPTTDWPRTKAESGQVATRVRRATQAELLERYLPSAGF